MNHARTLALLGGLLGATALAAMFAFGRPGDLVPEPGAPVVEAAEARSTTDVATAAAVDDDGQDAERTTVELQELPATATARTAFALHGRVVDSSGAPIAAAIVRVEQRFSLGEELRDNGRGAALRELARERLGDGNGDAAPGEANVAGVRQLLRGSQLAPAVTTDATGRFAIAGNAFASALLTIAVR